MIWIWSKKYQGTKGDWLCRREASRQCYIRPNRLRAPKAASRRVLEFHLTNFRLSFGCNPMTPILSLLSLHPLNYDFAGQLRCVSFACFTCVLDLRVLPLLSSFFSSCLYLSRDVICQQTTGATTYRLFAGAFKSTFTYKFQLIRLTALTGLTPLPSITPTL